MQRSISSKLSIRKMSIRGKMDNRTTRLGIRNRSPRLGIRNRTTRLGIRQQVTRSRLGRGQQTTSSRQNPIGRQNGGGLE